MNKLSVLVLDDDVAVCRILNRILSEEEYQVSTSQTVKDAVAAIREKPFDAYVLDFRLPDGSGLDVAQTLRSNGSEAPIIFISGYDSSMIAEKAESLRVFDIVEKPFSRDAICDVVKKSLEVTKGPMRSEPEEPTPAAEAKKRSFSVPIVAVVILLLLVVGLAIYLLSHGP
jgi:two-component system, NtrC family, response regulator HydG